MKSVALLVFDQKAGNLRRFAIFPPISLSVQEKFVSLCRASYKHGSNITELAPRRYSEPDKNPEMSVCAMRRRFYDWIGLC